MFATMLEFSATVAVDRPMYKTLPGLSTGIGWGFSIGILPTEKMGVVVGANSTLHKMDADTGQIHLVRGNSRRISVYLQGQYRFLRVTDIDFLAYLGGTYNSIDGGDKNGSYLGYGVNPDELGYSGWGGIVGAGAVKNFAPNYSLSLSARYNLLDYSKHQKPSFLPGDIGGTRKGSSLVLNLGIIYRIDFADF